MTAPMPTTPRPPAADAAMPCAATASGGTPPQPAAGPWLNDAELRAVAGGPIVRNESF